MLTLESRRAPELALLVVNYGGEPALAPAVREVPIREDAGARALAKGLLARQFDVTVLMTGVGTRLLLQSAPAPEERAALLGALAATRIVARGSKPVAALREVGMTPWLVAQPPNTWREVLGALDGHASAIRLDGARVAVQEYGTVNPDLHAAFTERGAVVTSMPVYTWDLPEDIRPLQAAVIALTRGDIAVVVLTVGVQLVHLLRVAADMRREAEVRRALAGSVIASIGPMTSDAIRRQGLHVSLEASHPKMGFLVKEAAEYCEAACATRAVTA